MIPQSQGTHPRPGSTMNQRMTHGSKFGSAIMVTHNEVRQITTRRMVSRTASSNEEGEIVMARPRGPDLREAFRTLDDVSVIPIFEQRAAVMKTVPRFLRGPLRNALKIAMEEVLSSNDVAGRLRGWKLFVMIPRMLLPRPLGGGVVAKEKLVGRFELFRQGHWTQLIHASGECDQKAAQSRHRRRRRAADDVV